VEEKKQFIVRYLDALLVRRAARCATCSGSTAGCNG
jgi:hypothetical protein